MSDNPQDEVVDEIVDETVDETVDNTPDPVSPELQALIDKAVDARLADIKKKLDKVYAEKAELQSQLNKLKQEKADAEKERLRKEGKELDALNIELEELRAQLNAERGEKIQLNRDLILRQAINSHQFRNENAREMAFRDICANLVQDEQGVWAHKSGVTIAQAVETFVSNPENSFLLKPKPNSGSGSGKPTTTPQSKPKGSLFEMSQEEVLRLASEGKLRK